VLECLLSGAFHGGFEGEEEEEKEEVRKKKEERESKDERRRNRGIGGGGGGDRSGAVTQISPALARAITRREPERRGGVA
jgi:hypothetical protein